MSTSLMTQRDRTELRRILKARFELLHQQLQQRQMEVRNNIEETIRQQHADAVKQAKKKSAQLEKKIQKLREEAIEIQVEMAQLGVVPGTESYHRNRHNQTPLLSIQMEDNWSPVDLQAKINRAYQQITEQAGLHQLDLRLQQLQLEEELAVGALGSDEAKSFLERVPTLDKILPLNGNIPAALEAAVIEDEEDEEG